MKKLILLVSILFGLSVMAQEYIPGQLQLGATPLSNSGDFISALGTVNGNSNIVTKTQITVQQLIDAVNAGTPNLQVVTTEGATTSNLMTITKTGEALKFQTVAGDDKYITFDGGGDDFRLDHGTFNAGFGFESNLTLSVAPRTTGVYSALATFSKNGSTFNNKVVVESPNSQLTLKGTNSVIFNVDASVTSDRTFTFGNRNGKLAVLADITDWATISGSRDSEDLEIFLGAKIGEGLETHIQISDDAETVVVNAASGLRINGSLLVGSSANKATVSFSGTQGRAINLQDKDGTIALLSDIPSGGGSTNLGYTAEANNGVVTSSTGTDATIPSATTTSAGLMKASFYEEGTFTAALVDTGGGATYTATTATANYTRIGNQVNFVLKLSNINTTGSPTIQRLQINTTGLPNVVQTGGYNVTQFLGGTETFYSITAYRPTLQNISFFTQRALDGSLGGTPMSSGTITNGEIEIHGSYITNTYTH